METEQLSNVDAALFYGRMKSWVLEVKENEVFSSEV